MGDLRCQSPIELEITEILQNMGIAKIHRTVDSDDTHILIIIPNDTTSCKSIEFKIDDTPENAAIIANLHVVII